MMRYLLIVFIIVCCNMLLGLNLVQNTITIDSLTLAGIRESLAVGPNFDQFLFTSSRYENSIDSDEASDDEYPAPRSFNDILTATFYLKGMMFETEYQDQLDNLDLILYNLSRDNDIDALMSYFQSDADAATRGLRLINLCINSSILYDCLYTIQDTSGVADAVIKLKNIMQACILLMQNTENYYNDIYHNTIITPYLQYQHGYWAAGFEDPYPQPPFPGLVLTQYRLGFYGAMGLAALILAETSEIENNTELYNEMISVVNYIDSRLLSDMIPDVFPEQSKKQGMLAFHTANSGAYFESIGYAAYLLKELSPYFVTRKRLSGGTINYYDNQYVASWINDITHKMLPTKQHWVYNDQDYVSVFYPCVTDFFYNASNLYHDIRQNCVWYLRCMFPYNNGFSFMESGASLISSRFLIPYLSNPNVCPKICDIEQVPEFIHNGSWSTSEFTILRKPIYGSLSTVLSDYYNSSSLNIMHENSFVGYHGQADQLSYSFIYQGENYLIDPGYRVTADSVNGLTPWNYGREWLRSVYAHNSLVVNPELLKEGWELWHKYWSYNDSYGDYNGIASRYRPTSSFNKYNDASVLPQDIVQDPARVEYFQRGEELDLLRTSIMLDDFITESPISKHFRSFLRSGSVFVIYDVVESLDSTLREYWNLYQFGVFSNNIFNPPLVQTSYGFQVRQNNSTVDIVCGSTDSNDNLTVDSATYQGNSIQYFPTNKNIPGALFGNKYGHKRGKLVTQESVNPRFLTVLVPLEDPSISIDETIKVPDIHFGVSISGTSRFNPNNSIQTYIGCGNGSNLSVGYQNFDLETNGQFYITSYNTAIQPLYLENSFVIFGGDYLSLGETDLFRAFDTVLQGITATFENNELNVIFHDTTISYPRFKIYRNGVAPEQFSAIMRIQTDTNIPYPIPCPDDPDFRVISQDIVQSLAYDDDYFYVNYSWEDLVHDGLVDSGNLTFVKGEILKATLTADLVLQGEILVTGTITVDVTAMLSINSGSRISFDNTSAIYNYGKLLISGGEAVCRFQSLEPSEPWEGLATYPGGELSCQNVVIDNAITGIYLRGQANINDTEILNCNQGITIETNKECYIENSLMHENDYGVVVSNNYSTNNKSHIDCNEICSNGIGIVFYNSNMRIKGNNIHNNLNGGLYLDHCSDPIISNNLITFSENTNFSRPEILLDNGSYPILDNGFNDINTDGIGYSLRTSPGYPRAIYARNNYWGTTNSSLIRMSIYPPNWDVAYRPYSMEPNTEFLNVINNSFHLALVAEESGDLTLAAQLYTSIVTSEPDSLYALQSLGRLNSIYAYSDSLVSELRGTYQTYMSACTDSTLFSGAEQKLIMLDRFDAQYDYAIQSYENMLYDSTTEMDSLLCLLDIAYTMQEMYYDDQGKGTVSNASYIANGLSINTLKEAKGAISALWQRILTKTENSIEYNSPVPTMLEIGNYPNPFNPSTTITFTQPLTGKVKLCVFNIRGQMVKELINGEIQRGFHKIVWDGKDDNSRSVSSGIYFIRIESGGKSFVHKVMMLK